MSVYHPKLGVPMLYTYGYDQLNRLKRMNAATGLDTTQNIWTAIQTDNYRERIKYDPNGNILKYDRYDDAGSIMDSLTYLYSINTNKLTRIDDVVTAAAFANDLDDQATGNYTYDAIGNLVKDSAGKVDSILWTVYGKIKSFVKTGGSTVNYTQDAGGNMLSRVEGAAQFWFVRDASGNIMALYGAGNIVNDGHLTLANIHMYGSSMLGMIRPYQDLTQSTAVPQPGDKYFVSFERGQKLFEML